MYNLYLCFQLIYIFMVVKVLRWQIAKKIVKNRQNQV